MPPTARDAVRETERERPCSDSNEAELNKEEWPGRALLPEERVARGASVSLRGDGIRRLAVRHRAVATPPATRRSHPRTSLSQSGRHLRTLEPHRWRTRTRLAPPAVAC